MSIKTWIRHPIIAFRARGRSEEETSLEGEKEHKKDQPLREFVYIDEVSLNSLLVSQGSTILVETRHSTSQAAEDGATTTVEASLGSGMLGGGIKAGGTASRQTSQSNNTESTRKSVIQTNFKEFRDKPLDLKFSPDNDPPDRLAELSEIASTRNSSAIVTAKEATRGTLVEIEVSLAVDPLFTLAMMVDEWNAMASDFEAMFGDQGMLDFLNEAKPLVNVLKRFLSGLIPVRATAVNHVIVKVDDQEYIVHKNVVEGFQIETRPLQIVGATEQLGYLKDVRRVLFSNAKFTIMGRIARDGLHKHWTPVKLADLFSEVAPDLITQLNDIKAPNADDVASSPLKNQQDALVKALDIYKALITPKEFAWDEAQETKFDHLKHGLASGSTDPKAQREAFKKVLELAIDELSITAPTPDTDISYRNKARETAQLKLLPTRAIDFTSLANTQVSGTENPEERLLDVEIVAIYW